MSKTPHQILKEYWGFDDFRPLQLEVIHEALQGRDVLGLLPTGAGKSVCYQIPALIKPGTCLVISPLIALMKDQAEQLKQRGIKAEYITAGTPPKLIEAAFDNCQFGKSKFLFLSPERIQSFFIQERIKNLNVNYIAIDEAHCISQWGHDFRSAYRKVSLLRTLLPKISIIALTATATKRVASDIQLQLDFPKSNILKGSFDRKNITFSSHRTENKIDRIAHFIKNQKGSGIVYIRSRKLTEELCNSLKKLNIRAEYYHAGLSLQDRSDAENNWKKGITQVIVATNAFGMGIDKANVEFVVHYGLPNSLEEYLQEAGRGGRDGQPAQAVLFYNRNDILNLQSMLAYRFPDLKTIKAVYQQIANYAQIAIGGGENEGIEIDLKSFAKKIETHPLLVHYSIKTLENAGYLFTSDEVNRSSQVQVLQARHEIEQVINNSGFQGKLLSLLLRSYTGLFNRYCNISEGELATNLETSVSKVKKGLEILEQTQIIHYKKQDFKPKVFFATPRVVNTSLLIPKELLVERKKAAKKQLEAITEYAIEEQKCRVNLALFYFDEQPTKKCGHCDNCLKATTQPSHLEYVLNLVTDEPKDLNSIILTSDLDSKATIQAIRQLMNEKKIISNEFGIKLA